MKNLLLGGLGIPVALEVLDGISPHNLADELARLPRGTWQAEALGVAQRFARVPVDPYELERQELVLNKVWKEDSQESDGPHLVLDVDDLRVALGGPV